MPGFSEHFIHFLFPLLTPLWWFHDFFPLILWQVTAKKMQAIFSKEDYKTYEAKKKMNIGRGWVVWLVWGSSSTMSSWSCYNWMMICSQNDLKKAPAFGVFFVSGGILCLHVCENSAMFSFGSHKHVVSGVTPLIEQIGVTVVYEF